MILKGTSKLRADAEALPFRKMGECVKVITELKAECSTRQKELKKAGLTNKEAKKLHIDARKFDILDAHKAEGGPFTSAEEVDAYLSDVTDESKAKQNACVMR